MTVLAYPRKSPCIRCKHFLGVVQPDGTEASEMFSCEAFDGWIPDEILKDRNDHRQAFPGDHGIHFEPIDK